MDAAVLRRRVTAVALAGAGLTAVALADEPSPGDAAAPAAVRQAGGPGLRALARREAQAVRRLAAAEARMRARTLLPPPAIPAAPSVAVTSAPPVVVSASS